MTKKRFCSLCWLFVVVVVRIARAFVYLFRCFCWSPWMSKRRSLKAGHVIIFTSKAQLISFFCGTFKWLRWHFSASLFKWWSYTFFQYVSQSPSHMTHVCRKRVIWFDANMRNTFFRPPHTQFQICSSKKIEIITTTANW